MAVTIFEAVNEGAARLSGIADDPRREARSLLAFALDLTLNDLIRHPDRPVDTSAYEALLARRIAREPMAHIVGHREFWSLDFRVSAATLIPRPDSETVIEAALAAFAHREPPHCILDLGTGTGCLLLALLTEFPAAFGVGLDLAADAAALAKTNAARLGLADRTAFVVGDWTNAMTGRFDLIVCNPPYIPTAEVEFLMPEVSGHEPWRALDGGDDGYEAYRAILSKLRNHLGPRGVAVLELGYGQARYVVEHAHGAGFTASLRDDLAGIPRAVVLGWPYD